jgi:hypothetical protein
MKCPPIKEWWLLAVAVLAASVAGCKTIERDMAGAVAAFRAASSLGA